MWLVIIDSITDNRNYITAFADAKTFFTNSGNSEKLFLFLTDGRRSDYNGVFGNVTEGLSASIQVYTAYGNMNGLIFITSIFLSPFTL